jgi:hypothetical protein
MRNLAEDSQVRLLHQLWFDADDYQAQQQDLAPRRAEPRLLYYVPEDGVPDTVVAATRERLKRFGTVAEDHITLTADADLGEVSELLRDARFRFGPSSLSNPL